MSIQSLDEVLAGVDASEQEMVNDEAAETQSENAEEAEEGGEQQQDEDDGAPERDAHGALHAERQRVKRKYTDTVAEFDRKFTEATANFDKRLAERENAINQQWEQRFSQFAQQFQQPRKEVEPQPAPDVFENPTGFLDHGVKQHLDPVNQRISSLTESFSRRLAIKEYGKEKVQAAFSALDQAARAGDPEAVATVQRVRSTSDDPYEEIVAWHNKTSVIREVGNDPEAFIQKRLEAALNDPAFLAKALEKAKGVKPAADQRAEQRSLPSLNRTTSAADDEGDEEDAVEVFNSALRRGVNR